MITARQPRVVIFDLGKVLVDFDYSRCANKLALQASRSAVELRKLIDHSPLLFRYETGQIDKAREVLNRFKGSNAGALDVNRIEEALSRAPASTASPNGPMPMVARRQLLQLALAIADRTL